MIRLLYAGAANLAEPNAGMDLGSRCHFEELSDDRELAVDAISVCTTGVDPTKPPTRPARLLAADAALPGRGGNRLLRKLALLARGGILFQTGFTSKAAADALRAGLATKPDILLVDHIAALANISLGRLVALRLRGCTKIVVVSHDISSELLRDRARLQPSKLRAVAVHLHALHCHLYENVVFGLAHRVFFVSTDDRDTFKYVNRAKTDAMCQVIELPPSDPAAAPEILGRYLVFVGAPSFFPNGAAIDWIERGLAPALLARMPDLRIILVGRGTDVPTSSRPPNVTGLGFVADPRLHSLLRHSCGALSPVVHGSGIKIKVLEAIAAGCAIFATEHSLRGYEFMHIDPMLHVDDPARSADRIASIVGDPARLSEYRQAIADRWQVYQRLRKGRLSAFVKGAVGVTTTQANAALLGQPSAR